MTNFPWPMDKPIEEIEAFLKKTYVFNTDAENYLLARLKKAESDRDMYKLMTENPGGW